MKSIFKTALLFLMLFVTLGAFAQDTPTVDLTDPYSLAAYLTTFITYAITFLLGKVSFIPNWILPIIAIVVSAGITLVVQTQGNPDLSYLEQFLLGVASIALHQTQKQLKEREN